MIDCVVAPFDQSQDEPVLAVSVTLPPWQNVVGPEAVIVGAGGVGLTLTETGADDAEHPLALVTVTSYEPEAVTVIDCVVAPFDHRYEADGGAVSVTLPPAQNEVRPDAVITGVGGTGFTTTAMGDEVDAHPFVPVTVTE